MLTRVSIALSLICIGTLLLSACGWSPDLSPYLPLETFVLWQTNAGVPPTILGSGEIMVDASDFDATGTIFPSQCSPQRSFKLRGSYLPGTPPRDAIAQGNNSVSGITGDLAGVVHGGKHNRSVLPVSGSMTIQNWCHGSFVANVEARPGPDFKHTWHSFDRSNGHLNVDLTLKQTNPDGNGIAWIWGDVNVHRNKSNNCWMGRALTPHKLTNQQTESTFALPQADGQRVESIILTNLPTTLNPAPPAEFESTVHITGGPCDSQTFRVTLKSR